MKVSVTTLQAFHLLQTEDWFTDERFLDQLSGVFVRTPEMRQGEAFHAILETPDRFRTADGYSALGITFPDEVVAPCLAVCIEGGTRETRGSMTLEVAGERVTVSARADQIVGTGIIEYKTRWKPFDYEMYAESRQWRLYTQIFGAQWVTYNVFVLSNTQRAGLRLVDVATPTFYPYADVVADTDRLLQDFVGYIHERGLERYVADREAAP